MIMEDGGNDNPTARSYDIGIKGSEEFFQVAKKFHNALHGRQKRIIPKEFALLMLDTYSHVAPGLQEVAAQRFDDLVQVKHNKKALVAN